VSPILLIDNYDSFTYNLFQMVQSQTDHPVVVYRNDAIDLDGVKALQPNRIILSPGPGHPSNDSDFGVCKDIILHQEELGCPILGVCLGHQGIVHHLGGRVIQAPVICHGKTSSVGIRRGENGISPLLDGLSNPFQAMRYHSLVADDATFPDCLQVTAREMANGLIMALQHKTLPIYGVQFHPESIGTPEGAQCLRNFVEKC
jgi:anthranilate synthase/aminodeoxychorismate synthase-like glutamine amidotransferase